MSELSRREKQSLTFAANFKERQERLVAALRVEKADIEAIIKDAGLDARYAGMIKEFFAEEKSKGSANISPIAVRHGLSSSTGNEWAAKLGVKSTKLVRAAAIAKDVRRKSPNLAAIARKHKVTVGAVAAHAKKGKIKGQGRKQKRPNPKTKPVLDALALHVGKPDSFIADLLDVSVPFVCRVRLARDREGKDYVRKAYPKKQDVAAFNSVASRRVVLEEIQKKERLDEIAERHGWRYNVITTIPWEYGLSTPRKPQLINTALFFDAAEELVKRQICVAPVCELKDILRIYFTSLSPAAWHEVNVSYRSMTPREEAFERYLGKLTEQDVRSMMTTRCGATGARYLEALTELRAKQLINLRLNVRPQLSNLESLAVRTMDRLSIADIKQALAVICERKPQEDLSPCRWMQHFPAIRDWPDERRFLDSALTFYLKGSWARTYKNRRSPGVQLEGPDHLQQLTEVEYISLAGISAGIYQALHFSLAANGVIFNRHRVRHNTRDRHIIIAPSRETLEKSAKGFVANPH